MAIAYKFKNKNKENIYLSVIEKSGGSVEFTIVELWENIKQIKKLLKERESLIGVQKATLNNIRYSHGVIIGLMMGEISFKEAEKELGEKYKITEKDRLAIDMYERSRRAINGAQKEIDAYQPALEADERSLAEVCKALKITRPEDLMVESNNQSLKEQVVDKIVNGEIKQNELKKS